LVEAFGHRQSLLLPSIRLRHHRSTHLPKLFRVCAHCVGEAVPRPRLGLGDVEFGAQKSDSTFDAVGGGHAQPHHLHHSHHWHRVHHGHAAHHVPHSAHHVHHGHIPHHSRARLGCWRLCRCRSGCCALWWMMRIFGGGGLSRRHSRRCGEHQSGGDHRCFHSRSPGLIFID